MTTMHSDEPTVGVGSKERARQTPIDADTSSGSADDRRPRPTLADWIVVALMLILGLAETVSAGLGWPWLRLVTALAIAWLLLQRRRAPLEVLVAVATINLAVNIALRAAGHFLLVSGLMLSVAVSALVLWASGRRLAIGLGVVAAHALAGSFVNPNWSAIGSLFFYGAAILLALAARPWADLRTGASGPTHRPARALRVGAAGLVVGGLFVLSGGGFVVNQFHTYITRTRSPSMPSDWSVDAATLRRAAETSSGTHGPDGAIIHTVDYPHQLLAALEGPTYSVEADVTVIDGEGFLQHDPKEPVGVPLLEFLEYAAIAEFPIVKLDLKCDRVGPVIDEVQQAVDRFGLDPARVHFNADVFRGPGLEENVFGARTDLSFTDGMYNLIVMELETSDLVRVAEEFPESRIVISATTPKGPRDVGYSEHDLEGFTTAAEEVRAVSSSQSLAFAVRGDLAARSGPFFLEGLHAIDDSYVAAWWAEDVPPTPEEIEVLRAGGVTFFDLGEGVEE